ncbi:hypothetical protein [Devosia marina]|uniref:Uncharacterized protein n=1 Tax=Devosia marina TaxID=2683198 RepID=A0A7X3FQS0_9HYPH|nr:hypothetical protein [Devosia marina]MVS98875.1 hypothetical protein [Devosia marina]
MTDTPDWLDGLDETELVIEGRLTNERKDTSPQHLLPLALLQHTIGMDGVKRLHDTENFCAIVVTPSPDWTLPLMHLLKPWSWDFVQARVKPLRPSQIADDTSSLRTMDALAMGGRVLGIGHDPERLLPSSMRTAADLIVRLPPPNGEVIGAVIRRMFGRTLKTIPNDIVAGLEFDEIVACLRPGTSPSQCVERLKKAVASKRSSSPITQGVPAIHDLHGYGAAKEWALTANVRKWMEAHDIEPTFDFPVKCGLIYPRDRVEPLLQMAGPKEELLSTFRKPKLKMPIRRSAYRVMR